VERLGEALRQIELVAGLSAANTKHRNNNGVRPVISRWARRQDDQKTSMAGIIISWRNDYSRLRTRTTREVAKVL
jgi:hypothetical protein